MADVTADPRSSAVRDDDNDMPDSESTKPSTAPQGPRLGLPSNWQPPTVSERWNDRENDFTDEERKEAWDKTAGIVKAYSDELVDKWNNEIDALLVYAGLFSAVLTAFNVQSYSLLAPDPQDRILDTLQQISAQLGSFSVNPSYLNSTTPAVSQTMPSSRAPRSAVWLNTLWFSSLIFSLSAASIGIMVKQWLNEYGTGLSGSSRQTARLRQHRLNSLIKWRVGSIVAVLPVLLQIALVLFFAGLLVLLWGLNNIVAGVASALIGILFVVTATSILLPSLKRDCCYISPPAYWVFIVLFPLKFVWYHICFYISALLDGWPEDGRDPPSPLWRTWEIQHVSGTSEDLDRDIIAQAYTTTLDPVQLDIASPCLSELSPVQVVRCAKAVYEETVRYWTRDVRYAWRMMPTHFWSEAWVALYMMIFLDDAWHAFRRDLEYYCCYWDSVPQPNTARFASYTSNICSAVYETRENEYLLRNLAPPLAKSRLSARARQSIALVAQQVFDATTTDRRPTPDTIDSLRGALEMLLVCTGAPDPAVALGNDAKATIPAIRTFTRHVMAVLFERFRTLVEDADGEAPTSDIDQAWQYMNWFIDTVRKIRYEDDELVPMLVDALASLLAQDERGLNRLEQDWRIDNRAWFAEHQRQIDERRNAHHANTVIVKASETSSPDSPEVISPTIGSSGLNDRRQPAPSFGLVKKNPDHASGSPALPKLASSVVRPERRNTGIVSAIQAATTSTIRSDVPSPAPGPAVIASSQLATPAANNTGNTHVLEPSAPSETSPDDVCSERDDCK
ncbi:hypothetical protein C8Q76DRAFT_851493 [Earliella scabrosa]|nr:hypothetical protein C8Q76DRAFT_851493 [Earliella scabrosa]